MDTIVTAYAADLKDGMARRLPIAAGVCPIGAKLRCLTSVLTNAVISPVNLDALGLGSLRNLRVLRVQSLMTPAGECS